MSKFLNSFAKNESGAAAIEYGLIAALICVGLVAAVGFLTTGLNGVFTDVQTELEGAIP